MVDFAHTELVQQFAGKGELSMSLGEVEPVGNINFCRNQRIDAAQNLRKGWRAELSGFSNC